MAVLWISKLSTLAAVALVVRCGELHSITRLNYTLSASSLQFNGPDVDSYYKPIRIHVHEVIDEEYGSNDQLLDVIRQLTQEVVAEISAVVKVFPVRGALRFARDYRRYCRSDFTRAPPYDEVLCTGFYDDQLPEDCDVTGFDIPDDYFTEFRVYDPRNSSSYSVQFSEGRGAQQSDFILFAGIGNVEHCVNFPVLAFTNICSVDQFRRPIAAVVNLCPREAMVVSRDKLKLTMLHEVLHGLGFLGDMSQHFQICSVVSGRLDCRYRYPNIQYIPGVFGWRGNDLMLTTPTAVSIWNEHVQCAAGGYGPGFNLHLTRSDKMQLGNHWNYTSAMGSILLSQVYNSTYLMTFDRLTAAYLTDSGWYRVDADRLDPLIWGKGAGCLFPSPELCQDVTDQRAFSRFFCSPRKPRGCHYLHVDKGTCTAVEPNSSCFYYKHNKGASCLRSADPRSASAVEEFCADCRCFLSNITRPAGSEDDSLEGVCLRRRCTVSPSGDGSSQSLLEVFVEGNWTSCPYDTTIMLPGDAGVLECPPADVICTSRDLKLSAVEINRTSTTDSSTVTASYTTANTIPITTPHTTSDNSSCTGLCGESQDGTSHSTMTPVPAHGLVLVSVGICLFLMYESVT